MSDEARPVEHRPAEENISQQRIHPPGTVVRLKTPTGWAVYRLEAGDWKLLRVEED